MPTLAESFISDVQKQNEQPLSQSNAGWEVGAQLAKLQQDRQMQQTQIKLKLQELQNAKVEKLYSFIQGAHNYQNGGDRNNYLKSAAGYAAALGLSQDTLPKEALQGMGSDENMGRLVTLQHQVEAEQMTPAQYFQIVKDPEAFAKVNPTPPEAINIGKVSAEPALKDVLDRANARVVAGVKAGGSAGNFDAELDKLGKDARTEFAPLDKEKKELRSALEARDRIFKQLQKDPSGKTVSPQDVGGMLYSFLHTDLGRVNGTEIADQMHIPGLENMSKDALIKAVGGANPNVINNIAARLESAASSLDQSVKDKEASFRQQIDAKTGFDAVQKAKFHNVLNPLVGTISRPRPGSDEIVVDGQRYSRSAIKKLVKEHPDDPNTPKFRDALKGGGG